MLPVLTQDNLHAFWHDTISYQAQRGSPFSIWGLWGGLGIEQHLVQGAAAGAGADRRVRSPPSRRGQVAALGAAVLIALQLGVTHWFYLYIVWFFPLVMVAVLGFLSRSGSGAPATAGYTIRQAPRSSDLLYRAEHLLDRLPHRLLISDRVEPRVLGRRSRTGSASW